MIMVLKSTCFFFFLFAKERVEKKSHIIKIEILTKASHIYGGGLGAEAPRVSPQINGNIEQLSLATAETSGQDNQPSANNTWLNDVAARHFHPPPKTVPSPIHCPYHPFTYIIFFLNIQKFFLSKYFRKIFDISNFKIDEYFFNGQFLRSVFFLNDAKMRGTLSGISQWQVFWWGWGGMRRRWMG